MDNTVELVALTAIHRHTGPAIATGRTAEDGVPIMRQDCEVIPPGSWFRVDPTEAETLIAMDAAAVPGVAEARRAEELAAGRERIPRLEGGP